MPAKAAEKSSGGDIGRDDTAIQTRAGESFVQGKMSRVSRDRMPDAAKDWLDDLVHHGPTSNGKSVPFFPFKHSVWLGDCAVCPGIVLCKLIPSKHDTSITILEGSAKRTRWLLFYRILSFFEQIDRYSRHRSLATIISPCKAMPWKMFYEVYG